MLPKLPYKDQIRKSQTLSFNGINRNPAAIDGTIYDTENMDTDRAPLLAPRGKRIILQASNESHQGMVAYKGLVWIESGYVYYNGRAVCSGLSVGRKKLAVMNDFLTVFPDKEVIYLKELTEPEPVTQTWTVEAEFRDESLGRSGRDECVIFTPNFFWNETNVRDGQVLTISGASDPANNRNVTVKDVGVREIRLEPGTLIPDTEQTVTITRTVTPDNPNAGILTRKPMDASVTGRAEFKNGTYKGSLAVNNTIKMQGVDFAEVPIQPGDAVTISGAVDRKNNQTIIVREVDGDELRFYENSFVAAQNESVTISRSVPDLEQFFVHENRLWGYKGNVIYCSKIGDATNFGANDLLESDAWALQVDATTEFTGCISYQGYPTFLTENAIYRIYGDRPSQYRLMCCGHIGVLKGCGESLAIAGEILYYVSPSGVTRFSGGYPQNVHGPLGDWRLTEAFAASDGVRYMVSAKIGDKRSTLIYDTRWDSWHRYDNGYQADGETEDYVCFAADTRLYMMTPTRIMVEGKGGTPDWAAHAEPEAGKIISRVWFNPFTGAYWAGGRSYGNPSRKGTSKFNVRVTIAEGCTLEMYATFDQKPEKKIATLNSPHGMRSRCIPIVPTRSDNYRLRIEADGDWTLHSITREEYSGSDIH